MRSLKQQISAMERLYPNLPVLTRSDRSCVWRGTIRPYRKKFQIEVGYRVPLIPENVTVAGIQPRVQVRRPVLEWHPDYDEGPIPHVYWNEDELWFPYLCLFDPGVPEWTASDLLADTTIPWTERWLINYEFWLATGRWEGGGRHVKTQSDDKRLTIASVNDQTYRGAA
jgi:hypothetical protein